MRTETPVKKRPQRKALPGSRIRLTDAEPTKAAAIDRSSQGSVNTFIASLRSW